MNTRQKLTLGIAAIFMVTLTIVGVTYAYFVTRVTGDENTPVNVSTVTLGDVKYVAGNGNNDTITLSNVLPGTTVYKTFSVINQNEDTTASDSYFRIFTNNSLASYEDEDGATKYYGEFIHGNAGDNNSTDFLKTCYGYQEDTALDTTVIEPKMSTEEGASDTCFDDTSVYNNIVLTLWEVADETAMNVYSAGTGDTLTDPAGEPLVEESKIKFNANTDLYPAESTDDGISIKAGNGTVDGSIKYYVLKVEYLDTAENDITGDENQNAENMAGLNIMVSIKA